METNCHGVLNLRFYSVGHPEVLSSCMLVTHDVIDAVLMKQTGLWTLKEVLQSEKAEGPGRRLTQRDCSGEESEDDSTELRESKLPGNRL
ncbi:hypothetical protein HGM15179_006602 [Zosterops borbonicus]|uniref:Uncharacterized protein n=1 Tax=Zosterops borbonicus TaxID=364589 RepID=A0A8K1GM33_9PASS|nr:hypothetical protein HGM15179_006602 [Zosterops borbonicus]